MNNLRAGPALGIQQVFWLNLLAFLGMSRGDLVALL